MARYTGIHKIKGTIDDTNYYSTRDGDFARRAAKISKERFRTGPEFAGSRRAGKVFGLASAASGLIRRALHEMIVSRSNRDMHNKVLAALQKNATGLTRLSQLPFHQLRDFDMNKDVRFRNIFTQRFTVDTRRPGHALVTIPSFKPAASLYAPENAGFFRLMAGAAVVNPVKKTFKSDIQSTGEIAINHKPTGEIRLALSYTPSRHPVFIALSVVFSFEVNGYYNTVLNHLFLPVFITDVIYTPLPPSKRPTKKATTPAKKKNKAAKKKTASKKKRRR